MEDQLKSSVDEDAKSAVDNEVLNVPPVTSDKLPRWLRKLQNESWQAEMLVSGGAIFALFGTFDLITVISDYALYSTNILYESFVGLLQGMIGMIAFVLIVGFVVHLVMRGFWIGLIGLNYVYPQGINKERLKFAGKFASSFRNTSNNEFILRLDRYCSTIFALTFLSLFSIAGLILYMILTTGVITVLRSGLDPGWVKDALSVFRFLFLVVGWVAFVDFVLGGRLKRVKWLSVVYYPIYKIVSVLTLSFVYRRLYYTLVSNIGGFRLTLILGVPIALIIAIAVIFDDTGSQLSGSFFRKNASYAVADAFLSIESEVVDGTSLDISIIHLTRLEDPAFEKWKLAHKDAKEEDFSELSPEIQMDIIQQLYLVDLDGKRVPETEKWFISKTKPENDFMDMRRIVLRKSIDLAGLAPGRHDLAITIDLDPSKVRSYAINREKGVHARIPFLLRRK